MSSSLSSWTSSISAMQGARGQMMGMQLPFAGVTPSLAPLGNTAGLLPHTRSDPFNMGVPFGGSAPFASTLQQNQLILPQPVGETARQANPEAVLPLLTMPVEHDGINARFEVPSKNELGLLVSRHKLENGRSVPRWDHSKSPAPGMPIKPLRNGWNAGRTYDKGPSRTAALSHANVLGYSQLNAILFNDEFERYKKFEADVAAQPANQIALRRAFIDDMYLDFTPARIVNGMYTTLGPVVDTTLAGQSGFGMNLIRSQTYSLTGVSQCLDYLGGEGMCPGASYYLVARRFKVQGGQEPLFTWVKDPDLITNLPMTYKPVLASNIVLFPVQLAIVAVPDGGLLPEEYRHYTTYDGAQHYDGVVRRLGRVFHTYDERTNFTRPYSAPRPPSDIQPVYDVHAAATRRPAFDLLLELSA